MSRKPTTSVDRWHRLPRAKKRQQVKPKRCAHWRCATGWAAVDGHPFCLHCRALTQDRGDLLRAKAARMSQGRFFRTTPPDSATVNK
jgi:hypothetical protein